jgi:hypothetical protein
MQIRVSPLQNSFCEYGRPSSYCHVLVSGIFLVACADLPILEPFLPFGGTFGKSVTEGFSMLRSSHIVGWHS